MLADSDVFIVMPTLTPGRSRDGVLRYEFRKHAANPLCLIPDKDLGPKRYISDLERATVMFQILAQQVNDSGIICRSEPISRAPL